MLTKIEINEAWLSLQNKSVNNFNFSCLFMKHNFKLNYKWIFINIISMILLLNQKLKVDRMHSNFI